MRTFVLMLAAAGTTLSMPAVAQDATSWTGLYAGAAFGKDFQRNDDGSFQEFDTNLDGTFGDTVRTGAGANAFSPGFCDGRPVGTTPGEGCRPDEDKLAFSGHLGYDQQIGGIVIGAVGEFGVTQIQDANTSFSTTPASYTLSRDLDYTGNIRARAGFAVGPVLPYVTGGAAFGRISRSFTSSNRANAFTVDDPKSFEWGYTYGGGLEAKVLPNMSVGLLYLYNRLEDEGSSVSVTRGTAPATNPFVLVNPNGTTIRRSDERFTWHSARVTASVRF